MKIVVALGGNALLERGELPDAEVQEQHVQRATDALAPLVCHHQLVITHGNGPQVGVLALESESDPSLSHPYPFDTLVAETQGLIGNWLLRAVERSSPGHRAVCLLTRTVVDPGDPAFSAPKKFVGRIYTVEEASELARAHGLTMRRDGEHWRRVVASPEPTGIVELKEISSLLQAGNTVICAGGGGIPVVRGADGDLQGADAVVDKDLSSALLAASLHADALLLLTDVDAVQLDYGTPQAHAIRSTTVDGLRGEDFAAGSMGPKVEAACRFVETTGRLAAIGRLADAAQLLAGLAGTIVRPSEIPAASTSPHTQLQEVTQ